MQISRLHYITQDLPHRSHAEQARLACEGGVRWVQLRVKGKPYQEWLSTAKETQAICRKYSAVFIVNDNVLLAKELGADGVHLGKTDMSPMEARTILGPNPIIGGTANSLEDVKYLLTQPIDYIGLGPYRFTKTKEKLAPVLGADGIRRIITELQNYRITGNNNLATQQFNNLPIIAIGGIVLDDIKLLMETGIHGVAVSSAINLSDNPKLAANQFVTQFV